MQLSTFPLNFFYCTFLFSVLFPVAPQLNLIFSPTKLTDRKEFKIVQYYHKFKAYTKYLAAVTNAKSIKTSYRKQLNWRGMEATNAQNERDEKRKICIICYPFQLFIPAFPNIYTHNE